MFEKNSVTFPFRRRRTFGREENKNLTTLENSLQDLSIASLNSLDFNEDDGNDHDSVRTGPLGLTQLNDPPEPLVELVFVHGLGGGSRKSWSKTRLEHHFWPRSWLPRDPDFQHCRIHSFGYKSAKSEVVATISGIPEYAASLLGALRDSPAIRHSQNAIVLVGHSMGGLVIKKAFIQAHTVEAFKELGTRILSLYFLGTPHAGSEFTKSFQAMLRLVPALHASESISDLDPASRLLESLNEGFPRVAEKVEIRTFFEAEPSKISGVHRFVVPRHSACLNYQNEVCCELRADHRGLCKYEKPTDPNFITVRNALSATVERIVEDYSLRNQAVQSDTLQSLRNFLDIQEPPEDDLADHEDSCLSDDTCSWFTSGLLYRSWRDQNLLGVAKATETREIILIEAEPGAGKSILAAQVINNLQRLNLDCSYYFFDSQDREKSKSSRLIRSLAFQMALLSPIVRDDVLDLGGQSTSVQVDDDKHVWRRLFTNCIFKAHLGRQHYWVVDGLDECPQAVNLMQMFTRIDSGVHLKILVTTRPQESIHRELSFHSNRFNHVCMSKLDTLPSVRAYVETRAQRLRLHKDQDRFELIESILDNADGSFLWVKLILDDMSKATGPKQIQDYLERIPKGMNNLYADILEALDEQARNDEDFQSEIPALKAILKWALCANPPLTVEAMEAALRLEGLDGFVDSLCGKLRSLVVIDHSKKVRAVHKTASAFLLLAEVPSEFVVSAPDANQSIATLMFQHLRTRLQNDRAVSLNRWLQTKSPLDEYALLYFSDHFRRAPLEDHELFISCEQFLTNCGITWIAAVAASGSLKPMIKTSQNLRHWLQSRANRTPQLGALAQKALKMQQWAVDLTRLVAKFGRHLQSYPSSIYVLVPPFVPKESVLYRSPSRTSRKPISVVGFRNETWDDRLCSMFYHGTTCAAVACGPHNFAVALRNGIVHIYDNNTLQVMRTVHHGAVVKLLKYSRKGSMLLSAGFRTVRSWAVSEGTQLWELAVREPKLAAEFIDDDRTLISISSQHKLIKQDSETGAILEVVERRPSLVPGEGEQALLFRRELQYAEFSVQAEMLATMQRERPIHLTDIEDRYEVGIIELEPSDDGEYGMSEQPITAMTFCGNIDIALLAVVYRDGVLAVFDRDLGLLERKEDAKAVKLLAGSPDGRILATANNEGVIVLYDFEQLTPLHVLHTSAIENIRSLVFSEDGQRIVDIRDRQANLWAPPAMVGRFKDDTDSLSESTLSPTVTTSDWTSLKNDLEEIVDITAVIPVSRSSHFVCGRERGHIILHNMSDAKPEKLLYQDPDKQWVAKLLWRSKYRVLACLCGTATIVVVVLAQDWAAKAILMRVTFNHPVLQILTNDTADCLRVVVVTTKQISLWSAALPLVENNSLIEINTLDFETEGIWLESAPEANHLDDCLTLVEANALRRFTWKDLEETASATHISLQHTADREITDQVPQVQAKITTFDRGSNLSNRRLLLRSVSSRDTTALAPSASTPTTSSGRTRWLLDLAPVPPSSSSGLPSASSPMGASRASVLPVSHLIEHVIGFRNNGKQLIFLDKALWVCSYDMVPGPTTTSSAPYPGSSARPTLQARKSSSEDRASEYTRHMFIPDDWISSNYSNSTSQLLFVLGGVNDDCLVFVRRHEVAVIKEPFSHAERMKIR